MLSETDPCLVFPKREQVRFLGKGKVEIKVVIDEKCHKDLEKLKNLLSHKNPSLSYGELISILSKEALKKHDPKEKNTRRKKQEKIQKKKSSLPKSELTNKSIGSATSAPKSGSKNQDSMEKSVSPKFEKSKPSKEAFLSGRSVTSAPKSGSKNQDFKEKSVSPKFEESESSKGDFLSGKSVTSAQKLGHKFNKISRYIPSHLRKYIWERDRGQCTYVHHETKRRCASRYLLQIDHIQPFALGGRD